VQFLFLLKPDVLASLACMAESVTRSSQSFRLNNPLTWNSEPVVLSTGFFCYQQSYCNCIKMKMYTRTA